jgi:hypothetical protein
MEGGLSWQLTWGRGCQQREELRLAAAKSVAFSNCPGGSRVQKTGDKVVPVSSLRQVAETPQVFHHGLS